MARIGTRSWQGNREAAGFATSLVFVCLASARDVSLESTMLYLHLTHKGTEDAYALIDQVMEGL